MTALARSAIRLGRRHPAEAVFALEVVEGLAATPKRLPAKYFYDAAGSRLFEEITSLPEYYPTRTELGILRENAVEISRSVLPGATLIEFGSGSTTKVRVLLQATSNIAAYVPVDISAEFLSEEAARLQRDFPALRIVPLAADFTRPFDLPPEAASPRRVGFFPGSTIGNFEPPEAAAFLRHAARVLGVGATFIAGVDLVKSADVLHAAYNDSQGVTAKFNLNLLRRFNRELDADFDLDAFEHRAFYNSELRRIEMHLVSVKHQKVRIAGRTIEFRAGETVHTENSYKYTIEAFVTLARGAGWTSRAVWTDPDRYFSVHALALDDAAA